MHGVGSLPESNYAIARKIGIMVKVNSLKLSEIFKEGSDARKLFGKFYAVSAIGIIMAVLVLLALVTRGG